MAPNNVATVFYLVQIRRIFWAKHIVSVEAVIGDRALGAGALKTGLQKLRVEPPVNRDNIVRYGECCFG